MPGYNPVATLEGRGYRRVPYGGATFFYSDELGRFATWRDYGYSNAGRGVDPDRIFYEGDSDGGWVANLAGIANAAVAGWGAAASALGFGGAVAGAQLATAPGQRDAAKQGAATAGAARQVAAVQSAFDRMSALDFGANAAGPGSPKAAAPGGAAESPPLVVQSKGLGVIVILIAVLALAIGG